VSALFVNSADFLVEGMFHLLPPKGSFSMEGYSFYNPNEYLSTLRTLQETQQKDYPECFIPEFDE